MSSSARFAFGIGVCVIAGIFMCPRQADAQAAEPAPEQAPADAPPPADGAAAAPGTDAPAPETPETPPPAADPVEDDAQAYTRIVLQHDALVMKEGMRQITPAESARMPALRAQGAAIGAKYAPGGPMAAQAAAYQSRVKALSATLIPPARLQWIADAFPTANAIVAAYSTDAERRAALLILRDMLDFKANPLPPSGQQKRTSYMRAMDQIAPPGKEDPGLIRAELELTQSAQFRFDVVNKFVPAFAVEADNELAKVQYEEDRAFRMNRYMAAYLGSTGLVMASPFLYVLFGQRQKASPPNPNPAFQLPPKLSRSPVYFQTFGFTYDCGEVVEIGPESRCTLQTPDGRRIVRILDSSVAKGDILGMVTRSQRPAPAGWRNHTQGGGRTWGVNTALPIDFMFWGVFLSLIGVYFAISYYLVPTITDINPALAGGMGAALVFMFLYLYVVIGLVNTKVPEWRTNKFEDKWQSKLWDFMESRAPMLGEIYKKPMV